MMGQFPDEDVEAVRHGFTFINHPLNHADGCGQVFAMPHKGPCKCHIGPTMEAFERLVERMESAEERFRQIAHWEQPSLAPMACPACDLHHPNGWACPKYVGWLRDATHAAQKIGEGFQKDAQCALERTEQAEAKLARVEALERDETWWRAWLATDWEASPMLPDEPVRQALRDALEGSDCQDRIDEIIEDG